MFRLNKRMWLLLSLALIALAVVPMRWLRRPRQGYKERSGTLPAEQSPERR